MIILKKPTWVHLKNLLGMYGSCSAVNLHQSNYSCQAQTSKKDQNSCSYKPVLAKKVADFLVPENCRVILDATFGAGGHTRKLLERSKKVKILCLDRDPIAFRLAVELQDKFPQQIIAMHGKFSDLPQLLKSHGYSQNSLDGVLFDLGCSYMQFDNADRGFSLNKEGPLDMRMDGAGANGVTAADVLAYASQEDLNRIFKLYGDELHGKKIAKAIVETRYSFKPPKKTNEFRDLISATFNNQYRVDSTGKYSHISTKAFLALRMFVNNELNETDYAMMLANRYLKIGGVMIVLTCNVLEDRLVKNHITGVNDERAQVELPMYFYSFNKTYTPEDMEEVKNCKWKPLNKHVITPDRYEMDTNPRSKTIKLRACIKMP